ncbi:NAD-dependent epimerase/dehydratase family protein [Candidatus Fermentibacterales bacterium]|nr:NAD-dependent epimerase/dehydratase family protein [Candidatus Fermentibacterales bacterium]
MRAFLTGVSGFVGSHLADRLRRDGHDLVPVCRPASRLPELSCSLDVRRLDFLDVDELADCMQGVDAIYHAAGATSGRSQDELDRANVATTRCLLEARSRAAPEALFVLVSSLSAAGPSGSGGVPVGPYGRSKLLAEMCLRKFERWVIVRPPAVFGPGDRATAPLFGMARAGLLFLPASRSARVPLVYVEDLAEMLASLPSREEAVTAKTLVPAYPEPFGWRELAGLLERAAGRKILTVPVPGALVRLAGRLSELAGLFSRKPPVFDRYKSLEFLAEGWDLDKGETVALSGWSPATPIEEALRRTLTGQAAP